MSDYRSRLIEEKVLLGDKIIKLDSFIVHNDAFDDFPSLGQQLMRSQLKVMMNYYDILGDRIAAADNFLPSEPAKVKSLLGRFVEKIRS